MWFTVLLLFLSSAVLVFFSKEFAGLFKKIWNMPGVPLFLPLFLVSWLIGHMKPFFVQFLIYLQMVLSFLLQKTVSFFPPSELLQTLIEAMILCLLACVPAWFLNVWTRYRGWGACPDLRMVMVILWAFWVILYVFLYY